MDFRFSVQANVIIFLITAVSLNLTPDYVLDSEKPFSTGRYDCRIRRGCIFSVLGERKDRWNRHFEVLRLHLLGLLLLGTSEIR